MHGCFVFFVRSMPTFVCFLSLCVFCFAVSFFFFHFSAKIRTVQCTLLYIHCFSSVIYIICLKVTVCSKCSHFQLCYIQCDNNSSNNNKNKRKKNSITMVAMIMNCHVRVIRLLIFILFHLPFLFTYLFLIEIFIMSVLWLIYEYNFCYLKKKN